MLSLVQSFTHTHAHTSNKEHIFTKPYIYIYKSTFEAFHTCTHVLHINTNTHSQILMQSHMHTHAHTPTQSHMLAHAFS